MHVIPVKDISSDNIVLIEDCHLTVSLMSMASGFNRRGLGQAGRTGHLPPKYEKQTEKHATG